MILQRCYKTLFSSIFIIEIDLIFLDLTTVIQVVPKKISKDSAWSSHLILNIWVLGLILLLGSDFYYNFTIKISWYFTPETDAYLESSLKKKPCRPGHLKDGTHQEGPCLAYQQIIWIPDLMHRSQNLSQEVIGKNWQKVWWLCVEMYKKWHRMVLMVVDCRIEGVSHLPKAQMGQRSRADSISISFTKFSVQ